MVRKILEEACLKYRSREEDYLAISWGAGQELVKYGILIELIPVSEARAQTQPLENDSGTLTKRKIACKGDELYMSAFNIYEDTSLSCVM